jgi:hypothetical protein
VHSHHSSIIKLSLVFRNLTVLQKEYSFSDSQLLKGAIGKGGTIQGSAQILDHAQILVQATKRQISALSGVHDSDTKYGLVIPEVKTKGGCVPTFVKKRIFSYILILTPFFLYFTSYRICPIEHFKSGHQR